MGMSIGPYSAYWDITYTCNFKCRHCYNKDFDVEKELSFNEKINLIDQLVENKIFYLKIAGGEPFLTPRFMELLQYIDNKKFYLTMVTNGTLVKNYIPELRKIKSLKEIQVSLDGHKSDSLRLLRPDADIDIITDAIGDLCNNHFSVTINFTLTKLNYNSLDGIVKLAKKLNVSKLNLIRYSPSLSREDFGLTYNEYNEVLRNILLNRKEWLGNVKIYSNDRLIHKLINFSIQDSTYTYCSAGSRIININPDGRVYACTIDSIGSIKEYSLSELIHSKSLKNIVKQLEKTPKECENCRFLYLCRDGCTGCMSKAYNYLSTKSELYYDLICENNELRRGALYGDIFSSN